MYVPYLVGLEERNNMARMLPENHGEKGSRIQKRRLQLTCQLTSGLNCRSQPLDTNHFLPVFKTCIASHPSSLSRKQDQNSDTRLHRFVRRWASSCRVFLGGLGAYPLALFASFQTCREVLNTRFIPRAKMKSLYVYPMGIHIYLTRS